MAVDGAPHAPHGLGVDTGPPVSAGGFQAFRNLVLHDPALQEALRCSPDRAAFVALVVRLGAERGCTFSAGDVSTAMQANRRAWLERWVR